MSKTPRTDAAILQYFYGEINHGGKSYLGQMARADKMEKLETELTDMREMFKDYVESVSELLHEDTSDACAEHHNNLHEKAKEVLGL